MYVHAWVLVINELDPTLSTCEVESIATAKVMHGMQLIQNEEVEKPYYCSVLGLPQTLE